VSGKLRQEQGQLAGWSHVGAGGGLFGGMDSTDDVCVFDWVVRGQGEYRVVVSHERAGRIEHLFEC
jgi:hypothetical protein